MENRQKEICGCRYKIAESRVTFPESLGLANRTGETIPAVIPAMSSCFCFGVPKPKLCGCISVISSETIQSPGVFSLCFFTFLYAAVAPWWGTGLSASLCVIT